jgi:2-polyprenyl-6-methoxyphenol hydroxylase-like FAD-dependent oxidoreductase
MKNIYEPAREVPVVAEADVVVAGGGPGGLPAAIAAARHGAKTILIERYGFLGGLATAALVVPILGHTASGRIMPLHGDIADRSRVPIVEGLLRETVERMHALRGAPSWQEALQWWGIRFNAEAFKRVADEMVQEVGVRLFLHTLVTDAIVENGRIVGLIIENKSGRQAILGEIVIDATGDADVAFRAGAVTTKGRAFDGLTMPMGCFFHLDGLPELMDAQQNAAYEQVRHAALSGRFHLFSYRFNSRNSYQDDHSTFGMSRWAGDSTNARDLTRIEVANRREVWKVLDFIRNEVRVDGVDFSNVYLRQSPVQIGPRESRQVIGDYVLTHSDLQQGLKFEDAVARGSWWVDIHCPYGHGIPVSHCVIECPHGPDCPFWIAEHDKTMIHEEDIYPPDDDWYDIPYRSLTAKDMSNLLVSGRCISATSGGMSGVRVMGTCMAVGQAAGTAAALAARANGLTRDVDVVELRRVLQSDGALV